MDSVAFRFPVIDFSAIFLFKARVLIRKDLNRMLAKLLVNESVISSVSDRDTKASQ